ncbi:hypothetical protein NQZ71_25810 (plasmid) [Niallia taxi]|uniref:SunI/YnzG family protein n=1 Tax=Niallia taxi TaxID=2499688 RepID=UPI0011AA0DF4|nr:hypothetical protein [Niallia taxi]MDE5052866.1 hypothetical protein [Niallia taxi]WOD65303.1 hypothetical protein NQZ71_25810 [Niallia taxi]
MYNLGIEIKKTDIELLIKWQLTEVAILNEDILEVVEDETYAGEDTNAIRIGTPYGTTDRIYIKTKKRNYILYTTNKIALLKKINGLI